MSLPPLARHRRVLVHNGGFGSALAVDPAADGFFYILTDRGPTVAGRAGRQLVFVVPSYTPRLGRFRLAGGALRLVSTIRLLSASGRSLTGLPRPPGRGPSGATPVNVAGRRLAFDRDGVNPGGLVVLSDGTFWIGDEYEPALVHFDARGRALEWIGPAAGTTRTLPRVLGSRRPDRGLQGLTMLPGERMLAALMASPLDNPSLDVRPTSRVTRIVLYDLRSGTSRQYLYIQEAPGLENSEIAAVSSTRFLVLEHDGRFALDPAAPARIKRIYLADLSGATDVSDPADGPRGRLVNGRTLEQMSEAALNAAGIRPVRKRLLIDLLAPPIRYLHDRPAGLAVLNDRLIAVSNDDDFGITGDGRGGVTARRVPGSSLPADRGEVCFIQLE
jgi:hypothetical protein